MKKEEVMKKGGQILTMAVAIAAGMWIYKLSGNLVKKIQEKATA